MFNLKKLNLNFEVKFYRMTICSLKNRRNYDLYRERGTILWDKELNEKLYCWLIDW